MKDSLRTKLEKLMERQEELDGLLSDPSVINNQNKFRELSQEYAELRPIVSCFMSYIQTISDIESAKEMLRDNDAEIQAMAADELKAAEEKYEELEKELQILLLPKDPNDKSNIFLKSVQVLAVKKLLCLQVIF